MHSELHAYRDYLSLERRLSPATVKAYLADIEGWIEFLAEAQGVEVGQVNLRMVELTHVKRWVAWMTRSGMTARSVNRKISTLRSFGQFLKQIHGETNVMVQAIPSLKQSKRVVRALDRQEVERLIHPDSFTQDWEGHRDRLMILTFYTLGLRRAELIAMRHADIDLGSRTVRIIGKRNKERMLPLIDVWLEAYQQFTSEHGRRADWVFHDEKGHYLGERYVYSKIRSYLNKASSIETQSPHVLRHTFATHLLDMGADLSVIRELLGHANLSATQIYTHASIEQLKRVVQQSHPRGRSDA